MATLTSSALTTWCAPALRSPAGYSNPKLMDLSEVHGGSPWGAGCLAGPDGSRQPSALELDLATHQGKHLGGVVSALCKGRA